MLFHAPSYIQLPALGYPAQVHINLKQKLSKGLVHKGIYQALLLWPKPTNGMQAKTFLKIITTADV